MPLTTLNSTRLIAVLAATVALAACNSESSDGGNTELPSQPTLSLSYQPNKTLAFEWSAVDGVDHYRLLENPDGQSGYQVVADKLSDTTLRHNIDVPLYDRINARYLLDACLNDACSQSRTVQSNEVAVEVDQLVNSIGFFKAFSEDETVNSTNANAQLGASVALSEDGQTLVVGAPKATPTDNTVDIIGLVYTYERTAAGEWKQSQRLKASNAELSNKDISFGFAVSLSADGLTLAVGAPGERRNNIGVVNLPEDTIESVVGTPTAAGAVYLFTRASRDENFTETAYIKSSDNSASDGDQFGRAISLSADGSRLAVSVDEGRGPAGIRALPDDDFIADNAAAGIATTGAVYLYSRDDSDDWHEQAYIKASNVETNDRFGSSVSLSADGNSLAVGANGEGSSSGEIIQGSAPQPTAVNGNNQAAKAGAAYLFQYDITTDIGDNSGWRQTAYIKASDADSNDEFGSALQLSADGLTLAVGAAKEDSGNSGATYIFTRPSLTENWQQQAFIKAPTAGNGDQFGTSLSLSADGNRLAVSAPGEDSQAVGLNGNQTDNSLEDAGAVYLFTRQDEIWQPVYIKAAPRLSGSNEFSYGSTIVEGGSGKFVSVGLSLSGDGNTLAVGDGSESTPSTGINGSGPGIAADQAVESGAVYLY